MGASVGLRILRRQVWVSCLVPTKPFYSPPAGIGPVARDSHAEKEKTLWKCHNWPQHHKQAVLESGTGFPVTEQGVRADAEGH